MVSVYIQIPLTRQAFFERIGKKMKTTASLDQLGPAPGRYRQLRTKLGQTPWICQGTVVCRPIRRFVQGRKVQRGPYYLWTTKVRGQTVCLALSQAQYQLLAQAIENNRQVQKILEHMQTLTMKTILKKIPGVRKRK